MNFGKKMRLREEAGILRQFSILKKADVPTLDALRILGDTYRNLADELKAIHDMVRNGKSLYVSMRTEDGTFSSFVPGMVFVGEMAGVLDEALSDCSEIVQATSDLTNIFWSPNEDEILRMTDFAMMAMLLNSGLSFMTCLKIVTEMSKSTNQKTWVAVEKMLAETGTSVMEAMVKFPESFPNAVIAMVKTGQISNSTVHAFNRIVDYLKFDVLQITPPCV